jgi:hypothetical protein
MYLTISFGDGRHVDAVLLAMSRDRMRVVIPDQMDTVEFRLVYGEWTTEDGDQIELGSLLAHGGKTLEWFNADLFPRVAVASH